MPRAHTAAVIWYSGTPTRLPRRSFRAADARALVDEDARLPEKARRKNRDRDEVVGAPPAAHYIPAQRELRGVELPVLSHAPEDLLHAQHDIGQVDALCPDPTVAERLRPIIVARSQGQSQHAHLFQKNIFSPSRKGAKTRKNTEKFFLNFAGFPSSSKNRHRSVG